MHPSEWFNTQTKTTFPVRIEQEWWYRHV